MNQNEKKKKKLKYSIPTHLVKAIKKQSEAEMTLFPSVELNGAYSRYLFQVAHFQNF